MFRLVHIPLLFLTGIVLIAQPAVAAGKKPAPKAVSGKAAAQDAAVLVAQTQAAAPGKTPTKPAAPPQDSFRIEPLGHNVYAAIAKVGGKATSNAMFVVGEQYVVAAGAHMTKEVVQDILAAIAAITPKPVRYFVLAHHHSGYTHTDFDFPPGQDVIMAWQTWQDINNEVRKPDFPILFFNEGLTLKPGGVTVILTNLGRGHSAGDVVTFIPEAGVVFASDLFYVNSVGYMGGGYMREWVLALDFLEQLGAEKIIPGTGPVSGVEEVTTFKEFFREFLTAVLARVERGDSLDRVMKDFDMPAYRQMSGYQQLIKVNLQRAYIELQEEFGR
ncbi:MAG: MBL fold metallo-hydrolase [Desulfuromonadales bacterium]|nr:MBL fold metallo-hydrolase [Desulfuromonadales bacterium]